MFDRTMKLKASSGLDRGAPRGDRMTFGKDIQRFESGWPVGMPSCRPLGSALYEARSDLPDGRISRDMFWIVQGEMVLLHGFIEKSQKAPATAVALARKRLREVN